MSIYVHASACIMYEWNSILYMKTRRSHNSLRLLLDFPLPCFSFFLFLFFFFFFCVRKWSEYTSRVVTGTVFVVELATKSQLWSWVSEFFVSRSSLIWFIVCIRCSIRDSEFRRKFLGCVFKIFEGVSGCVVFRCFAAKLFSWQWRKSVKKV